MAQSILPWRSPIPAPGSSYRSSCSTSRHRRFIDRRRATARSPYPGNPVHLDPTGGLAVRGGPVAGNSLAGAEGPAAGNPEMARAQYALCAGPPAGAAVLGGRGGRCQRFLRFLQTIRQAAYPLIPNPAVPAFSIGNQPPSLGKACDAVAPVRL